MPGRSSNERLYRKVYRGTDCKKDGSSYNLSELQSRLRVIDNTITGRSVKSGYRGRVAPGKYLGLPLLSSDLGGGSGCRVLDGRHPNQRCGSLMRHEIGRGKDRDVAGVVTDAEWPDGMSCTSRQRRGGEVFAAGRNRSIMRNSAT
jgi:hypothetical protein